MADKDLITLDRAKQNIQSITDNSQDALLETLITGISDAIAKFCRRDFYVRSYDELYFGSGERLLLLREYPIQTVKSVSYRPTTVLKVQNTNISLNQQARVAVTSTGLTLSCVASGVPSTDAVPFADNVTLSDLATAINALGNGWSAQFVGDANDYGKWPSADLYVAPSFGDGTQSAGAVTARGTFAELRLYPAELFGFEIDPRGWLLRTPSLFDDDAALADMVWARGTRFRVRYSAGYSTIPEAVQQACAEWVALAYYETLRDPALTNKVETNAYGYSDLFAQGRPAGKILALLKPFRQHSCATNQG